MDGQFKPLRADLAELGIELNVVSNDEHVPKIKQHIHTIKEHVWATWCTLPFTKMPQRLIIETGFASNCWLNMFPQSNGILSTLSPRALVTGTAADYNHHCHLEFRDYVQTHEQHDNSMNPQTIGAIALRLTGNAQGGYFFFSLTTGKVIN